MPHFNWRVLVEPSQKMIEAKRKLASYLGPVEYATITTREKLPNLFSVHGGIWYGPKKA